MKIKNVLELIGNTPHLRLSGLFPEHEVWIKIEYTNPGGSIKDRIALSMIEEAEKQEKLKPYGTIIEPTSGNTGIGIAMVGAIKGYRVVLVMPESMSIERRKILKAYGAELILTPKEKGMKGAIEKALQINKETQNSVILQQFENPANPLIHEKVTSKEILKDFPEGIDYLITGIGTGGHISGVGKVLKEKFPEIKVFGVEPEDSAVISGKPPAPHPIQGIGAGFIPKTLNTNILDKIVTISKKEAFEMTKKVAKTDGLLVGISTGASLAAVNKCADFIPKNKRILTFNYDTGERYLSVDGLWE